MHKIFSYFVSNFFRDRLILISGLVAFLVNIILWIWLAIKFGYSQDRIPLHFNLVSGIDFVGEARRIYELPLFGLAVILANLFLASNLYERERLFGYFLMVGAVVVQIIILIATSALVNLIF
ncbi:MAG: hypothetical protein Q8R08_01975 [bacterium]|nr:hypothetical protein [bacterium]